MTEHRAIFEAIRDRQPDIAAALCTVHVAGVEQWLRAALSEPADDGTRGRPRLDLQDASSG